MNLIIHGPVGSGKGTQAKLLAEKFNLVHLSSGDLLRQEVKEGGKKAELIEHVLEKGDLVPFETILELLEPVISQTKHGFILDGTPRDLPQTEHLEWFLNQHHLKIDRFILLNIPEEVTIERLLKRAQIEHRTDDNLETIKHRLQVYYQETVPVIDYYRKKGIVLEIDGTPPVETIFDNIVNNLTLA